MEHYHTTLTKTYSFMVYFIMMINITEWLFESNIEKKYLLILFFSKLSRVKIIWIASILSSLCLFILNDREIIFFVNQCLLKTYSEYNSLNLFVQLIIIDYFHLGKQINSKITSTYYLYFGYFDLYCINELF